MGRHERRNFMALDDAFNYCRVLEAKEEHPSLYKLCAAIRTLDKAMELAGGQSGSWSAISIEAWSQVRDTLYNILVTSFAGYVLVYPEQEEAAIEPGSPWPENGRLEFYPEQARRREDSYDAQLNHLPPLTATAIRWCFAEGRQHVRPSDFAPEQPVIEEEEALSFMERLYEVCAEEATTGKKRAHQKWWQLYWQVDSCRDRRQRHEFQKEMVKLQSVWGRPN